MSAEPALESDLLFGARALLHLEARFCEGLLRAWEAGATSLRRPPAEAGATPAAGAALSRA